MRQWQSTAAQPRFKQHAAQPYVLPAPARDVLAAGVRRSRQFVARKELQNQAKHEYLKQFYESADSVDTDHLVYELKPSSPRLRAQQQQHVRHAELNQQLAAAIPGLSSWQELEEFLQQHGNTIHFLNVTALAVQAQALQQQDDAQEQLGPQGTSSTHNDSSISSKEPTRTLVAKQLAALIISHSSWFQPPQFAVTAVAMAVCDVCDPIFWSNFTAAAEHKVGSFTFTQLAQVLQALAAVGFVPSLQWVERCYRQASRHLHAAAAGDVAGLLWAWGELGYTPRDILFMNQVKQTSRRAFAQQSLSGPQLVALMHGLARMPKYAPNLGWLQAYVIEMQRTMTDLLPGEVVDLLLSLVTLGFQPPEPWLNEALHHLQAALQAPAAALQDSRQLLQAQQHEEKAQELLLLPLDLLQAQQQVLLPGSITSSAGADEAEQIVTDLPEMQQLQQLFAEAAAAEESGSQQQEAAAHEQQGEMTGAAAAADNAVVLALHRRCLQQQQQRLQQQQDDERQHQQQLLTSDHIGILCWCFGRLDFQPEPSWMQLLASQLLHQTPGLTCEVLVDVLQGLVSIDFLPAGQLQRQLLDRALQLVPVMQPEALRRLCNTLLQLEMGLEERAAAEDGLVAVAAGSSSTSVSSSSSSSLQQYLQQHQAQLAEAIAHRQGILLWQSSTQQLADVLAFLAASGIKPSPDYLSTAVSRAVEKLPEGCPVPALCTLLWALAQLGFKPHPQLLHQLLAALQRGLHLLSSQDLADAGWALCTLKHRPGAAWLSLYRQEVASKAAYMPAQALTDTLWALACFAAQPDREWLKRVVLAAGSRLDEGELSPQNAAVVVWALRQLGFEPEAAPQQKQQADASELDRAVIGLVDIVLAAA